MTGLFNIHTVFGSLSPKQSEQEERAVCFLPVELVSSSEPEVSGCLPFFTRRRGCHIPDKVSRMKTWPGLVFTIPVGNQTAHFPTVKAAPNV